MRHSNEKEHPGLSYEGEKEQRCGRQRVSYSCYVKSDTENGSFLELLANKVVEAVLVFKP